jgi:hypothetical protein
VAGVLEMRVPSPGGTRSHQRDALLALRPMPEQLFAVLPTQDRGFKLAVALDVTPPQVEDPARAVQIVATAHEVCPYSNATRGNIHVQLTANGRAVE